MIKSTEEENIIGSTTPGYVKNAQELAKHIYTEDEIERFRMDIAINNHPLAKKPTILRSKLAYRELLKNTKPTKKYLLPGQVCLFNYLEPKYKEDLEYYDRTPLTLMLPSTLPKISASPQTISPFTLAPSPTTTRPVELIFPSKVPSILMSDLDSISPLKTVPVAILLTSLILPVGC